MKVRAPPLCRNKFINLAEKKIKGEERTIVREDKTLRKGLVHQFIRYPKTVSPAELGTAARNLSWKNSEGEKQDLGAFTAQQA